MKFRLFGKKAKPLYFAFRASFSRENIWHVRKCESDTVIGMATCSGAHAEERAALIAAALNAYKERP